MNSKMNKRQIVDTTSHMQNLPTILLELIYSKPQEYILYIFFVAVVIGTFACTDESLITEPPIEPPTTNSDYFPLEVGNQWVFNFFRRHHNPSGFLRTYEGELTWEVVSESIIDDTIRYSINQSFTGMYINFVFYTPPHQRDTLYYTNHPNHFTIIEMPEHTIKVERGPQNLDIQLLNILNLSVINRYNDPDVVSDTLKVNCDTAYYFKCSILFVKDVGIVSYEVNEGGNTTLHTSATLDSVSLK